MVDPLLAVMDEVSIEAAVEASLPGDKETAVVCKLRVDPVSEGGVGGVGGVPEKFWKGAILVEHEDPFVPTPPHPLEDPQQQPDK